MYVTSSESLPLSLLGLIGLSVRGVAGVPCGQSEERRLPQAELQILEYHHTHTQERKGAVNLRTVDLVILVI